MASQKRSHGEDETEDGREEKLALLQTEEAGRDSIYQDAPVAEHRHGQGKRVFLVLLPTIFLPCFLFTLATAITDPVLPLVASQLGGSAFVAGLSVSVDRVMTDTFSLPASTAIQRLGAPATMALGAAVGGIAALAAAFAGTISGLVVALFVIGAGNAMWKVTRTSLIGVLCPPELRGRAVAFNTGVTRLAQIIGPAAGGFVEAAWPMERSGISFPLILRGACNLLAAVFVVLAATACPTSSVGDSGGGSGGGAGSWSTRSKAKPKHGLASSNALGTLALLRNHRAEFLGAGTAATLVLGCNMCRRALVPMVGATLELPVEVIGVAMTAMGAHPSRRLSCGACTTLLCGVYSEKMLVYERSVRTWDAAGCWVVSENSTQISRTDVVRLNSTYWRL